MGERPLSPHLSIYSPMLTMIMSIVHRATGVALYFGAALLAWWLLATSSGPDAYATVMAVAGSPFGLLVLFGFTWALVHHMLGGMRHFVWDMGHGFELPNVEMLARLTLVGSLVITVLLWVAGLAQ